MYRELHGNLSTFINTKKIIFQVPNDPFFSIDENLGEIRTRTALDFESQNVHYLTVVAQDKGSVKQLSSSSTFTVFVQDTPDEVPTFATRLYTATIPENEPNAYVATVQVRFSKFIALSKTHSHLLGSASNSN